MRKILRVIIGIMVTLTLISCGSRVESGGEVNTDKIRVEDAQGCVFFSQPGVPVGEALWEGDCKDGYASGKGKLTVSWKVGKEVEQQVCKTTMEKGIQNGETECKGLGGSSFTGMLANGQRVGEGIMTMKEGVYTGLWASNKKNGQGAFEWSKHNQPCTNIDPYSCYKSFEGNFVDNKFGKGTFTLLSGKTIEQTRSYPLSFNDLKLLGRGGWVKDAKGCQIWSSHSLPVVKTEWSGECVDGYASGEGTFSMVWEAVKGEANESQECTGIFKRGKLNGSNECTWKNGTHYAGTWKDAHPVAGEYAYENGTKKKVTWFEEKNGCLVWNPGPQPDEQVTWDGECFNGYAKGEGTLKFLSKNMEQTYVGTVSEGKRDGKGTYTWGRQDKSCDSKNTIDYCIKSYAGTFSKGLYGKGTFTLINGTKIEKKNAWDPIYWAVDQNQCLFWNAGNSPLEKATWTGKCVDGYASGKGTITMIHKAEDPKKGETQESPSQMVCEGHLKHGKLDGENDCKWGSGHTYSGMLKDDRFQGEGTFTWANGDVYKGEWANDMRNGQGELIWKDGHTYSGEWKDNDKHGKGIYTWLKHEKPCTETNRFYCYKSFEGNIIHNKFGKGVFTRTDGKEVEQTKDIVLTEDELIEHEKGIWTKDQNGCRVWSGAALSVEKTEWTGKCEDGYASGSGTITMAWEAEKPNKGEEQQPSQHVVCTGSLKKGKLNGYNECEWQDGTRYVGTWKDVHPVAGEYTYKSGSTSKVKWFEEKNGCLVWNPAPEPNEQVSWDGECFNGYAKGKGTLKFISENVVQTYVGEMAKGKKDGKGTYHWIKHKKPCNEEDNISNCYKTFVGKFSGGGFYEGTYTLLSGRKIAGESFSDQIDSFNRQSAKYVEAIIEMQKGQHMLNLIYESMENDRMRWELYRNDY